MSRAKQARLVLLTLLLLLSIIIIYQSTRIVNPTVKLTASKDFVKLGENIIVTFTIYNPTDKPVTYGYALYFAGDKRYEDMVQIKSRRTFEFGGHYKAFTPGVVEVTGKVFEGNTTISETTYYITVEG